MKSGLIALFACLLLVATASAEEQPVLKSQQGKINYLIGIDIGKNLKAGSVDVELDALVLGMKDGLAGKQPQLKEDEIKEATKIYNEKAQMSASEKNKKAGEEFLTANKTKEGVVTLPSGLQYKEIKKGTGKTPKATDMVTVNYRATLVNGKEFDNSYKRGQPVVFRVDEAFPGWSEGLKLMKEEAKWQLFIPANLAFERSAARRNLALLDSTVIYEVELISVKKAPAEDDKKKN